MDLAVSTIIFIVPLVLLAAFAGFLCVRILDFILDTFLLRRLRKGLFRRLATIFNAHHGQTVPSWIKVFTCELLRIQVFQSNATFRSPFPTEENHTGSPLHTSSYPFIIVRDHVSQHRRTDPGPR